MFGFHLRSNLRGPTFHLFASTSRNSFSINQLAAEKCELRPNQITIFDSIVGESFRFEVLANQWILTAAQERLKIDNSLLAVGK